MKLGIGEIVLKIHFGRDIKVWEVCNGSIDVYCELVAKSFLFITI